MKGNTTPALADGSTLKVLALACMAGDHAACMFLAPDSHAYLFLRTLGRISFPVFAFLLVEGFIHTSSRRRYGTDLLVFALISELPWHLVFGDGSHNVLFTLLAGFLGLCCLECLYCETRECGSFSKALLGIPFSFTSLLLLPLACAAASTDYSWQGYMLVICFYVFRGHLLLQTVIGFLLMSGEILMGEVLAFSVLTLYNGERGSIHGKAAKYACYAFYPGHLFILWLLHQVV